MSFVKDMNKVIKKRSSKRNYTDGCLPLPQ